MRFNFDDAERDGLLFCVLSKRYGLFFEEKGSRWICEVDPSLNVFASPKTGNLLVKDFGNRYPQFARAKGLQAVLTDLYGQDLQAKINDLAGCDYAPAKEWVDRENARNSSGNTAAQSAVLCCPTAAVSDSPKYDGALLFDGSRTYGQDKKKEKSSPEKPERQHVITSWDSAQGQNVLRFFEEKAGIKDGAADFLTQYGIAPLHSTGAYTFPANGQNSGFIIRQSGWEKVRQTAPKDKQFKWQQYPAKDGAPYLFGFNALPLSGENLFFLEGETDAVTFRYHTGAPVLSLGSTSNFDALPLSIAADLQARFKNIFVLWDADAAGQKGQKFADKHGFTFVDTAFLLGLVGSKAKDICAFYAECEALEKGSGSTELQALVDVAQERNGRILAVPNDRFSVPINHVLRLPFGQHLGAHSGIGAPVNVLLQALETYKKLSLISPAGTGKSTMLAQLSQSYRGEKMIIAVPTTAIAEQLHVSLESELGQGKVGLIKGGLSDNEINEKRTARVVVTVFDSAYKLGADIESSLLVVDEYHLLPSEYRYRFKVMRMLLMLCKACPELLFLSATPNYLLSKLLGTKVVLGQPEITNRIQLRVVRTKTKISQIMPLIFEKEAETIAAGHTVAIKIDSVNKLRSFAEYIIKRGYTVEIFTSKDSLHKTNENYQSIISTGFFKTVPNFLLFTTLIEAGVSIKSSMPSVYILDKPNAAKIIQLATRARYTPAKDGQPAINELVTVNVLLSDKKKKKDFSYLDGKTGEQLCAEFTQKAAERKQEFNENGRKGIAGTAENKTAIDAETHVYRPYQTAKEYEINELKIMLDIGEMQDYLQTAELLCERITHLDSRFTCEIIDFETFEDGLATEIADAKKEELLRANGEFTRLILGAANDKADTNTLYLIAAYAAQKNKQSGEKAQRELLAPLGFSLPNSQDKEGKERLKTQLADFAKTHGYIFGGYVSVVQTVKKAVEYKTNGTCKTTAEAFARAVQTSDADFQREKDRAELKARKANIKAGEACAEDVKNSQWGRDFCAKIQKARNNIQQGKRKDFTATELKEIVDAALKTHGFSPTKTFQQAKKTIERAFDIVEKEDNIPSKTAASGRKKALFYILTLAK